MIAESDLNLRFSQSPGAVVYITAHTIEGISLHVSHDDLKKKGMKTLLVYVITGRLVTLMYGRTLE